jgi:hypothetical protein
VCSSSRRCSQWRLLALGTNELDETATTDTWLGAQAAALALGGAGLGERQWLGHAGARLARLYRAQGARLAWRARHERQGRGGGRRKPCPPWTIESWGPGPGWAFAGGLATGLAGRSGWAGADRAAAF